MDFDRLVKAMGELNSQEIMDMAKSIADADEKEALMALDAFNEGMRIVGERFDACEYFIGDLIFAGQIMTEAIYILRPALRRENSEKFSGKVLLCTVEGDVHDIGKNIIKVLLEARGIEVIDLGVDVPPQIVVDEARAGKAKVIALSGVLTHSLGAMKATVEAFKSMKLRSKVKIIIGGACVDSKTFKGTGADSWAVKPEDCIKQCCDWIRGRKAK
jgi:methanogenic corrinoid protein MtbC1